MVIMGIIIVIYLLLGCLMDSLAMIMLTIPVHPVILTLGFDPIWFEMIIVVVSGMGVITPPVGISTYVVAGVAYDVPLHVIFKGTLHMLYAMIALAVPDPLSAAFHFPSANAEIKRQGKG